MIKNIIFDIYNVVVRFDSEKQIATNHLDPEDLDFFPVLFGCTLWNDCDLGYFYSKQSFLEPLIEEYPDQETHIRKILANPWPLFMDPDKEVCDSFQELSKKYDLYFLSNICEEEFDFVRNQPWFRCFKGHNNSYEAHLMKPQKEIYTGLLEKYDLDPTQCLFIDDTEENLITARELGISTIQFDLRKNDDFETIKKSLL